MEEAVFCADDTAFALSSKLNNVQELCKRAQQNTGDEQETTHRLTSSKRRLRPTAAIKKSKRKDQTRQLTQRTAQLQERVQQLLTEVEEQKRENLDLRSNINELKEENLDLCSNKNELNRKTMEFRSNVVEQERENMDLRNNIAILQEARQHTYKACCSDLMLCLSYS